MPAEPLPSGGAFLGDCGGSALGLALLLQASERGLPRPPSAASIPFVLAVGEAVRDGLPTAARAVVQGRSPSSGCYLEGHVGGALGARLARHSDALTLRGRTHLPGAVLVLDEDGRARLLARPDLRGLSAAETDRRLAHEFAPASVLAIGPAGERGAPLANLASGSSPPSFVGRGGLGAVFGALGLKALVVRGEPGAARREEELQGRLLRSPRLAARARGGTLELVGAAAVRGELAPASARAFAAEVEERREERHGCRGCPTPCGWVFARDGGARQGARFGASEALGSALGLSFEQALTLLARCDELGLDAKEVGALLVLERKHAGLATGVEAALARLATWLDPEASGAYGVAQRARELGCESEVPLVRGLSVRPARELAEILGQCVASGGTDPMKSFPFLLESARIELLRELVWPHALPDEALDPRVGAGKGRLVWGHENLVAAVDASGFCAFSAAGLLADGLATLDELARWILPAALRVPVDPVWAAATPGQRLLAFGAHVVLARLQLNALWRFPGTCATPHFAAAALAQPGMLDEYHALRALASFETPTPAAQASFGSPAILALARLADGPIRAGEPGTRRRDSVRFLGEPLGNPAKSYLLHCDLPAPLADVLAALRAAPGTEALFVEGRFVPAVFRLGRRLAPSELVHSGNELELVSVIGGG